MEKIKAIHFYYLPAEEHFNYMNQFKGLVEDTPDVKTLVTKQFEAFIPVLDLEGALINAMKKSDYTALIAAADGRVDSCLTGMNATIAAAQHSPDPDIVMAAQSLYNRFQAFGNIRKKNYEAETTDVNLLLADLRSPTYALKVNLVGLPSWVVELTAAEAEFEKLYTQRRDETAKKPQGRILHARRDTDSHYHPMVDKLNAYAISLPVVPDPMSVFMSKLNVVVDYFNERFHPVKKDISVGDRCIVEVIPPQKYTGNAITPIPIVSYREEGKKVVALTFAEDYSVTYRNNRKVGTAEAILHGKGAYKGQKIVTFNIEEEV
jgi:hypothetical protein